MPLIVISCAWIIGILAGGIFHPHFTLIFTCLIPLPLLFFCRRKYKTIILAGVCLLALFGGAIRFQSTVPELNEKHINYYNDSSTVEIKGVVTTYPELRDKTTHVQLSLQQILTGNGWQPVTGTVLVFAPLYSPYGYGDLLQVTGRLVKPSPVGDFNYPRYLAQKGIYSTMFFPRIEILGTGKGIKPLAWLYGLRERLSGILAKVLPEPQASLAQGIILGIRSNIPQSLNDNLSASGTTHLLAISGFNLSIVAGIMLAIGTWLFGRKHSYYAWLAMGTVWFYALLTGMQAPVVRGAIMASMFLTAEILGRQQSAGTSLFFAAAVMAGITPSIPLDASFQMSFLSTGGLIFIAPYLMSPCRSLISGTLGEEGVLVSAARAVADSCCVSLAAVTAVWPVIAYYFGIVSFAGPLATLLAAWSLTPIIIIGTITVIAGLIAVPLAQGLGWIVWLFISYLLWIVDSFARLPGSHADITYLDIRIVCGYYLLMTLAILGYSRRTFLSKIFSKIKRGLRIVENGLIHHTSSRLRKGIIITLGIIAILLSITTVNLPDSKLHVSILDVGEGDAILIQTPAHQDILVDGGPSPQAISLGLSRKMPFWDRSIDMVVLTHPHSDHFTGLIEVLRRYEVKQVLAPDTGSSSPLFGEWLKQIRQKNIPVTSARCGQKIILGKDASMEVLNPPSGVSTENKEDIDANTVVIRLNTGEVSFLLTSDIPQDIESGLVSRRARLYSTVLKVAHHGSNYSSSTGFLAATSPQVAVISVGKDNLHNHPGTETLERLENRLGEGNIYRTDRDGTVEFITDGERLWMKKDK